MYQDAPPVQPPGLSSSLFGSAGFGGSYGSSYSQMGQFGEMGESLAGAQAGNFAGNVLGPGMVHGGALALAFGAPMLRGARTAPMQLLGKAGMALDPFNYMGAGWQIGKGAAHGLGFRGMASLRGATGIASAARGIASVGAVGAAGVTGALVPLGLGLAATEFGIQTVSQAASGAASGMVGSALMNNIGGQFGGGSQNGLEIGRMLNETGKDIGKSASDMADMVRDMDRMKMFQTTRDIREFKERFKEILDTVKEVASTMQTSVDEALGMVGEMRTQGFYTSSDIKAQTLRQQAREGASGLSTGQMVQAGRFGSQYSRALGMRGRFGADFAQEQTAAVAYAVRQGTMSEEDVMERGGIEQVGANLAATQMRFLSSSRGRMMIANMMGGGNQMDPSRVDRVLGGDMTLESMVTGAANRGLGTLMASGSQEARENAMQYAGMGMVATAAAQSRQLHGGYSQRGIINMLGTMGVGRTDANLLLQQTMNMPQYLDEQREAAYNATQRSAYEEDRAYNSFSASAGRYLNSKDPGILRGLFGRARRGGESYFAQGREMFGDAARFLGRPDEFSGGGAKDLELANMFEASGGSAAPEFEAASDAAINFSRIGQGLGIGQSLFGTWDITQTGRIGGAPGAKETTRQQLDAYTITAAQAGARKAAGIKVIDLGGGKFITQGDLEKGRGVASDAMGLSSEQSKNLKRIIGGDGDVGGRAARIVSEMEGEDYLEGDAFTSLSRESQMAYTLAKASDLKSLDPRHSMLGKVTPEEYAKDKELQTLLRENISRESGTETLVGRSMKGRVLSGTISEIRAKSTERYEEQFNKAGLGSWYGNADNLAQELGTSEEARSGWARYLRSLQGNSPEATRDALAALEGIGKGDLFKIAQRADEDKEFRAKLLGGAGDMLDIIGEQAFSEHRGRAYRGSSSSARRILNEGRGGDLSGGLRTLENIGDIGTYGDRVQEFTRGILSDRKIGESEMSTLAEVFGGGQASNSRRRWNQLSRGTKSDIDEAGKELGLSESERESIKGSATYEERAALVIEMLAKKGLLDPAKHGAEGGKDIGDIQAEYIQANTRFVAAVNDFAHNIRRHTDMHQGIDLPEVK